MNRLALAVRSASEDALSQVSLESLADGIQNQNVSLEQEWTYFDDLLTLATGLENAVVSVESIEQPSITQYRLAREQAITFLKMSGVPDREVVDIFPSLEADNPKSGWERFKAFLVKLWNFIVEAAKKLYEFIDKILKKSSLAEKAAMMQLRALRSELSQRRNGLTKETTIPFQPGHRYLTECQMGQRSQLSSTDAVLDLPAIVRNIQTFKDNRDAFQDKMPQVVNEVIENLIKAIDALALGGTDEQISASVIAHGDNIKQAVAPMFPAGLKSALGFPDYTIPLIYDRVLTINDPAPGEDISQMTTGQIKDYISQLGLNVEQIETPADLPQMAVFPAMRINEIEQLLKIAESLINEGHSTDQQRKWKRLKTLSMSLGMDIDGVIKTVLKKQGLESEAQSILTLALNARHAMTKWISAPFMQINTVNIRVVESLLKLASMQIQNYELKDSAQEKPVLPAADKPKQSEKKETKVDRGDGDHEYRG
jgi:hypothetical protein